MKHAQQSNEPDFGCFACHAAEYTQKTIEWTNDGKILEFTILIHNTSDKEITIPSRFGSFNHSWNKVGQDRPDSLGHGDARSITKDDITTLKPRSTYAYDFRRVINQPSGTWNYTISMGITGIGILSIDKETIDKLAYTSLSASFEIKISSSDLSVLFL